MNPLLGGEIDPSAEELFQLLSELFPPKKTDWLLERYENVEVALRTGLASGNRSEHTNVPGSKCLGDGQECAPMGADDLLDSETDLRSARSPAYFRRDIPKLGLAPWTHANR